MKPENYAKTLPVENTKKFPTEGDLEQAKRVARKASNSQDWRIERKAVEALVELEDVEGLESYVQWKQDADHELSRIAKGEAELITLRRTRPQEYEEMKTMLEACGLPVDLRGEKLLTRKLLDARKSFREKGDEHVAMLDFLFDQLSDNKRRRVQIVEELQGEKAVEFLVKRLESLDMEQWKGQSWSGTAIRKLAEIDLEQTRRMARKAFHSQTVHIEMSALWALEELGTAEDVEGIKSYIRQRNKPDDELSARAEETLRHVKMRISDPQGYNDLRFVLYAYDPNLNHGWWNKQMYDAQLSLQIKGEDTAPALLFLFGENVDTIFRDPVVKAILRDGTRESKEIAMDFLAKQLLKLNLEEWPNEKWVSSAMKMLAKTAPKQAKHVARKALNSQDKKIERKALEVLMELEDVEGLTSYVRWKQQPESELSIRADREIELIALRRTRAQEYKEMEAMLKSCGLPVELKGEKILTQELLDARDSFRAQDDEVTAMLNFLFDQPIGSKDRLSHITEMLRGEKAREFLLKRMETFDEKQLFDAKWASKALKIIATGDPGRARAVLRRALNSQEDSLEWYAIWALIDIGTQEDVESLQNFYNRRKNDYHESRLAQGAIEAIKEREEKSKNKK